MHKKDFNNVKVLEGQFLDPRNLKTQNYISTLNTWADQQLMQLHEKKNEDYADQFHKEAPVQHQAKSQILNNRTSTPHENPGNYFEQPAHLGQKLQEYY